MKKCLSALLLIILLIQTLPVEALASVGKVLTDEELDRAYALTGLAPGEGLYHNGMSSNESMSATQLASWLEDLLDNRLHNVDDVLARARYRLAELEERYPTIYKVFTESPYYGEAQALALQVEGLRQELNYRLERVRTDINMISEMRSRMQYDEVSLFDSQRVRASARVEAAVAEIKDIRSYIVRNASDWDSSLAEWTEAVQYDQEGGSDPTVLTSLKSFLSALWKRFNLDEGSDAAFKAELRALLKQRFLHYAPGSDLADAFADDAIVLAREFWRQYDPDGETGTAIIRQTHALLKRLYDKYGPDGADDEALIDDLEALMRQLWEDYGPQSEFHRTFAAGMTDLLRRYGFDSDTVEAFIAELDALSEELWNRYGPEGEGKAALLEKVRELWSAFGGEDGSIARWLSSLFTAQSEPVINSAPVVAVSGASSRLSRLSSAVGIRSNDADATVTVISKDQVCLSFVTGVNQTRQNIPGVSVRYRDATKPDDPLSEPVHSGPDGLVILPANLFVADKYDEVHIYVEVDPREQGYRNYIIEDLEIGLGQTFMDTLVPMEDAATDGSVSNADEPYMISASFNGKDIMHSEYEMIYSPANNRSFTVKAVFAVPDGAQLPDLVMTWYENEGGFKSLKQYWMEPTWKSVTPEGYLEYTFTARWKQRFSPNASEDQRPAFSFGRDGAKKYPTKLVALRSATSVPLNEGTGPEGGVYASVLDKGFGMSFNIPIVDASVSLNLPITKYLPHLSIDPAGMVVMWIGMPILEKELEDSALNWESKDMKQFKQAQEWVEQKSWLADYKAQYALASDYYKSMPTKFMGSSSIDVGIFAVATGRWELDNENEDVKSTNIRVALGFGATLSYEYSWTMHYQIGPVPAYICFTLGVCAGVSLQMSIDFCWVNGHFQNWKIYALDEITYSISFYFAAQAGIGIKGFVEIWVRFVASFDIMIHMVLLGLDKCYFDVSVGIEMSAGATLFFFSVRKSWTLLQTTLYSSSPADNSLLEHYMNAEKNDEKVVEAAHLDPQSYPELRSELDIIIAGRNQKPSMKVVRVDNRDYPFFLSLVADKNGKEHWRVCWIDYNKDEVFDSTQAAIEAFQPNLNGYDEYAFDVYEVDGLIFLTVACAVKFDENGLPLPNKDIDGRYNKCNQIFYLLILKPDKKGSLTARLDQAYYASSTRTEDHFFVVAEPVALIEQHYGAQTEIERYYYESIDKPEITWAKVEWQNKRVSRLEVFGTFDRVTYSEDAPAYGITSFQMKTDVPVKCYTDEFVQSGMGKKYDRTIVRGAVRLSDDAPGIQERQMDLHHSPGFVALSKPRNGVGDSAIEVFDFEMNAVRGYQDRQSVVLAQGDIQHFELVQFPLDEEGKLYNRMIFYTERETNDDGAQQSRLYGLYLEPVVRDGRELTFIATQYAYDLVIPDGKFKVAYMGGAPYIYWVSALPKQENEKDNIWRVWTVAYDPATNAMTDASVFAEFPVPEYRSSIRRKSYHYSGIDIADTSIFELMLMGTGDSYFSVVVNEVPEEYKEDAPSPVMLCKFSELLKPVADLKTAITQTPAVSAGSFEDISLGIMNEGNLGIATIDVAMYEVSESASGGEQETLIETVHVNGLDPEKSKITMQGGKVEMTGAKVAHRAEDFDYTARQRDWVLSQERKAYKVLVRPNSIVLDSVEPLDSETRYVKTDVLMPGSIGVYNTSFKIPDAWQGKKALRFKVKALSVVSNQMGAMRNAVDGAEPALLTYVLDEETDKLVLQQPDGAAANAPRSGAIANETPASTLDLELFVHDLSVGHRVYTGWDGEKWLDIMLHNYAAFDDDLKLACAVYLDGASDPYYISLPYFDEALVSRATQTISMPLSALVDDPGAHNRARVEITAIGEEECALINNEFTVYLGGSGELRFVSEPEDTAVREGADVSFAVEVAGGARPYAYQWQIWDEKHQKWVDLPGFTEPTMRREGVERKWDGCRFRCVVTDADGKTITGRAFTLTVTGAVPTGDDSNLPLYLAVALIAITLLWLTRRRFSRAR